jgi:formate-dependent phosphoribosylglycinamide formyltransferase (GAR transformylase)
MSLEKFLKELESANKRELEVKVFGKPNNNLKTHLTVWLKTLKKLEKLANALGYEITFSKIKKR